MSILYVIIKTITIPGAMLHTFFEHMACRACRVLVDDARAVQFNEMFGHIDHELVKRKSASFDICFIPFLGNLFFGFLTLIHGSTSVVYLGKYSDWFGWICLYLGISFLTNLFPQIEDVMMIKENFFQKGKNKVSKIFIAPFYALFFVGARLEKVGLTLVTSVAFSFAVPYILGTFIPTFYGWVK